MVVGIGDTQVALTVKGHAVRGVELARLGPLLAETPDELPFAGELLHSPAHGADPDPILLVHADEDRPFQIALAVFKAGECAAKMSRPDFVVAPGKQRLPRSGELLHPPSRCLRGVDVLLAVEGQAVGTTN